jgi:hypothetical protein
VRRSLLAVTGIVWVLTAVAPPASVHAQRQGGASSPSARDAAPIDLTGYWVSYVTENWRYRMVTPAKGEYRRIPVSPAAVPIINAWDPSADDRAGAQCKSYGAGAIMNVPGRLHITWQDANTLRVDIDAGTQTRLFRFTPRAPSGIKPTWQGESAARWEPVAAPDPASRNASVALLPASRNASTALLPASRNASTALLEGGSLRVVTANMRAGYLRKNGVPYSERATMSEHFDLAPLPDGGELLLVTTVVEDPVYLTAPYVTSPHFIKERDGSKWDPTPCSSTW